MTVNPYVIVAGAGLKFTDPVSRNVWSIVNGRVTVDGVIDWTTSSVFELAFQNGEFWLRNLAGQWFSKPGPLAKWTPSAANPIPASENNTVLTQAGFPITDTAGNAWAIVGGRISVNGVIDQTTRGVTTLAYKDGKVWQRNDQGFWWSKSKPTDSWYPPYGTKTSPIPASPDNTIVLREDVQIVDKSGNVWEMRAGKVVVNGKVDQTTKNVIELLYKGGKVWQQNSDHLWWSKSKPTDTWGPAAGTKVNPEGPVAKSWLGGDGEWSNPDNWLTWGVPRAIDSVQFLSAYGRAVDAKITNHTLPGGLKITSIDEGSPTKLTFVGSAANAGSIKSVFGTVDLTVAANANFVNSGELVAQSGIGVATLKINLSAGSLFTNSGTIRALPSPVAGLGAVVDISGAGSFSNYGLIDIQSSTFIHSSAVPQANWGKILASGSASVTVAFGRVGEFPGLQYVNAGTIESSGTSSVVLTAARAFETYYAGLYNTGSIVADGGTVELDVGLQQAATGRVVVQNQGRLKLHVSSDGGTIEIKSGMLEFSGGTRVGRAPRAAESFHTDLNLSGSSATLKFGEIWDFDLRNITTNSADLVVRQGLFGQESTIHLVGRDYMPSEFTASGSLITFTDR
ncbi:MAG: hypothetical protein AB7F35_13015 [Acetobacteraceae bacterium]